MTNMHWPQFPDPYWHQKLTLPSFPPLNEDMTTNVTIIGAGISGITAGYLLSLEGIKVTIIDAGSILNGTTGHTTAKITSQHGLIYDEFINHFGEEKAKMYYNATDSARAFIKNTIGQLNIDCDYEEHDAYIYTNSDQELSKLDNEARAYEKLKIPGDTVDSMPFKQLPMKKALVMKRQAQFHPLKYLLRLVETIQQNGGQIFENTTAVDLEQGAQPKVMTRNGKTITSKQVICCSHYPFYDAAGFYFSKMYQERSYVVAVKSDEPYPGGMYLSAESPTRSVRSTPIGTSNLLLLGGESHKVGHGINTMQHYEALADFGKEVLGLTDIHYRWSAQDIYTLDKIPYIGHFTSSSKNIYIATGYRKWGMTNGTAAGMVLSDLITKGTSPYESLYTPQRFHADPDVKRFLEHNADVAYQFVKGKFSMDDKHPEDIANGEGAYVKMNSQKCGAYRDEDGELHVVDATCRHLGCEVEWNDGEKSWDCPCHGSRYSIDGDIIEGPTESPLDKVE
ncbi:(2Fe-2S)-binding protein [Anaerobacillus arseniciselenatis]|uniref:(2Fe-2S)-binding protein n=1 Tax=Anaerobacillus arseniciselenatis TaxID=85682 RepID=A0A1S2LGT4_9BACI|nr:FAD-dependent oxidoreductase [Anaerobacillus arseniciselenatis]OIJ11586.1 (2Fe-2S)-binding protein [Anaerobacillus arseniciselenatis]